MPETELEHLPARIWQELERAAHTPGHPWRNPVLASADASGSPDARIMVLREASAATQSVLMYTDARSPKVAALAQRPDALLLFWNPQLQWQLRVRCAVRVVMREAEAEQRWQQVRHTRGASDYLAPRAPGSALAGPAPSPAAGAGPAVAAESGSGHHLAVLRAAVHQIDWLALSRDGHRRALVQGAHVTPIQP